MTQKEEIIYSDEDSQEDFSPPAGGESKVKKLKKKLKDCQKEKEGYLTGWQRAQADLVNYRRRQEEAMEEFRKYSQENLIREILPVLDSLEMGVKETAKLKSMGSFASLRTTLLKPIKKQLESILEKYNLKEIKTVGEKFNPNFHEAVEMIESNEESGVITEEIQKGYLLEDKVLRVGKVRMAK
ncbi:MAG: nucleotide exchange factor GrpE [Candidatus Portnoybacteria bacterium RIFCSPLOWO2_12_FULL_39_9]|uniref:Protein GrpE n=1 Tax=Candidatus Portnoybacteria bacterium RIFCSPHIGHO2_12_FULL_38_9 TaxID=1801997 RepID=A0A1G2FF25_9BACT|nr:MAG: nucleotide exchange factor GrpE [Candidatus Portnoybacteria bacterium RBG_13_40_8]OGZ35978.1 MAG: nucleotide exchange factor GrpE [Candidatus Portnoybacteria bacterium RIFCSPHIGHO2_02_FULL_39_12]OGZ36643.1 MAG: nucleotide exchange factor GrpE [Candidatus Portnoybacteria bacterium RIFCSPHIGHO2_12_FULL_38_9]OGZ38016.1 MAG: nucleotide exchange factor GrpE [Candidatus Portnoybacteria bacterium RIFCSPLOWO2_01_FULL_38_39]OGZ40007.1 MAG: nucleotide exchange factor GrpE [Candidatus Portnoybacte